MAATPLSVTGSTTTVPRSIVDDRTEHSPLRTTVIGAAAGAVVGTAAALAVLAVGNIGSPVRVITGWAPDGTDLGAADVVVTTLVSVLIAAVGLAILERVARRGLQIWTIAVAVVTVLSFVPLWGLDIDTGSMVALTAMHVVVGAAVIAAQLVVRRPAR